MLDGINFIFFPWYIKALNIRCDNISKNHGNYSTLYRLLKTLFGYNVITIYPTLWDPGNTENGLFWKYIAA